MRLENRRFSRTLRWAAVATACAALASLASSSPQRPSVVLWVVDTTRADHLLPYGYDKPTTPFQQRMAEQGAVVEHCFAPAPWTKPSMAAIFSGRYPSTTGVFHLFDRLGDDVDTIATSLRAQGYETAGFSANPLVGALSNLARGFATYHEADEFLGHGSLFQSAGGSAAALARSVAQWLDGHPKRPFFLFIHAVDPHEEYRPSPAHLQAFADPRAEEAYRRQWDALRSLHPDQLTNRSTRAELATAKVDPTWFGDYGKALYDANLRAADDALASLWPRIVAAAGGDVIWIGTSDHGEEFLDHGSTSHGFSLYQELLHVPLVITAPGRIRAGLRIVPPVSAIDLYPTIVELLQLSPMPDVDGRSFAPLLRAGARQPGPRQIFAEKREGPPTSLGRYSIGDAVSVIDWPWKLVVNAKAAQGMAPPPIELFNLADDPGELTDRGNTEPAIAKRLHADLIAWQRRSQPQRADAASPSTSTPAPAVFEQLRQLGYGDR